MKNKQGMSIAVLGLGLMGLPMARRLADKFGQVVAWNRSAVAANGYPGLRIVQEAHDAVRDAGIVITMLVDGAAVSDVLSNRGVAGAMVPGSLLIDMSSISPAEAQEHSQYLRAFGISHLDAPVSGGTIGAETGSLAIMVGGAEDDFNLARPVFDVLGKATWMGSSGAGQMAKLANQIIVGMNIAGVAEALVLAIKAGLNPEKLVEVLSGGLAASTVLSLYGPRMIGRDFTPRGRAATHLKDIRNARCYARTLGLDLPFTAMLEDVFARLVRLEGDVDHSALILALENATHPEGSAGERCAGGERP